MSTRKLIIVIVIMLVSLLVLITACIAALSSSTTRPAGDGVGSEVGAPLILPQTGSERLRDLAMQVGA